MIISFENFSLFVNTNNFTPGKTTIFFIHGFTGSSKDWDKIIPQIDNNFPCIAIDLIGHGETSSPEEISFYEIDSILKQIECVLAKLKIDKVILAGYSMGGRIALNFANLFPQRLKGLILESTTAGIENEKERKPRLQNDITLADKIVSEGIESFIDYWMSLPIFSSQKNLPVELIKTVRKNKLSNNPTGLANSLRGFSTGKMIPLWEKLSELNFNVLLLAGEYDEKYYKTNKKMNTLFPTSQFEIVNGAGHNIHLEKPSEFIILVNRFLKTNFT